MGSTFFGLNIGRTGLYTYQAALDTTAHNIANAETEGYSRQVVIQRAGRALRLNNSYGMAGTGVDVIGINQLRDEYYDIKFRKNNTILGEYAGKAYYMTSIQNYLNDISVEGFTTTFDEFYKSLQEVANNPSSLAVRSQVINYGKSLTDYFNSLSTNLKKIQEDCNFEIRNMVDSINSKAQQIASLTKQINTLEVNGGTANDLRDQRAMLVDELSQIANVSVTEQAVGDGVGVTRYTIKMDGQTLVDGKNYNTLHVIPRERKLNQNDIDGLYDVAWENGQLLNLGSPSLGGSLKALYEVRDGNNRHNLRGEATGLTGDSFVTVTNTTINDIENLNIPESGKITIGNQEYKYRGFKVDIDSTTGNFTYTFELEEPLWADAAGASVSVGESINYKGIPYYLDQMNVFVRTYAKAFNDIHRKGKDLDNNAGMDFFTATNKVGGRDYVFGPYEGSSDQATYNYNTFNSQTGSYYENVPEDKPLYGSYYLMTAENFAINSKLLNQPRRFAAATDVINGIDNNDIAEALLALKTDKTMFGQGEPGGFMKTLIADVGIDTRKATNFAENQENILRSISSQRLTVSGVDMDEEAMSLIRFQNAYNLSSKVISVMDEIYDRLINYMGV